MEKEPAKRFLKAEPLMGGIALLLLLIGCFVVLRPFVSALMWAIILAYSLYPLQRMFMKWFRGSRTLAACLVTLTLAVMFAGPVVLIGLSLAEDGKDLASATRDWFMKAPETPPAWVSGMPLVGEEVGHYWKGFAEDRNRWLKLIDLEVKAQHGEVPKAVVVFPDESAVLSPEDAAAVEAANAKNSPHIIVWIGQVLAWAREWLLAAAKAVGQGVTQVLFSAFLAFFLLRDAPVLTQRLDVAVERLAGENGRRLIKVAGDTVRGVVFGILGTALAQALVASLGFWIAGVPAVVLLSVLTFFFAVIPFGPPLIWLPASLWLFTQGKPGYAIFMLIWGVAVISSVDNFLRPYLISQGSKMPFALIFCGVIGGALAFGLVGVFMGPILLAVVFRLIDEWSSGRASDQGDSTLEGISVLPAAEILSTPPGHGS